MKKLKNLTEKTTMTKMTTSSSIRIVYQDVTKRPTRRLVTRGPLGKVDKVRRNTTGHGDGDPNTHEHAQ